MFQQFLALPEPVQLTFLAATGLLLLALITIAVLLARRPAPPDTSAQDALLAQLAGRLDQLGQSQAGLSKSMDDKLHTINQRLHSNLQESTEKTLNQMGELQKRLAVIDKAQANIEKLSGEMVGLQDILSNKQTRGAFGEVQLENLISQVLPPSAYDMQVTLSNGRRADCVIRLPNPPGDIVVDSKFPLNGWQKMQEATDDVSRKQAERELRTMVLKHVADIAERYILPGETAESALMFLPSEAVYADLHAYFADVLEKSYRARVWIVSPTTMMATLNTIRAVLRDVRMREQAHVIQQEVMNLLEDVTRLGDRVGKLRTHFEQANKDIDQIETSTGKIARRAEKVGDLQLEEVEVEKELLAGE